MQANSSAAMGCLAALMLIGCQPATPPTTPPADKALGLQTLVSMCASCHGGEPAAPGTIAPTLAEIKAAYRALGPAAFAPTMTAFLKTPATTKVVMPTAVAKHGPMPALAMSAAQVDAVVAYLRDEPVETAAWHANVLTPAVKHGRAPAAAPNASADRQAQVEYGASLAMATKAELGQALLQATQQHGTLHALTVCNERAQPLTQAMSTRFAASIRRVSDKPRNPQNRANPDETAFLVAAAQTLAAGETPAPRVERKGDEFVGYYPIVTNTMCLACHGQPSVDIQPEVASRILELYPADEATGYQANQLRGIFVVQWQPTHPAP